MQRGGNWRGGGGYRPRGGGWRGGRGGPGPRSNRPSWDRPPVWNSFPPHFQTPQQNFQGVNNFFRDDNFIQQSFQAEPQNNEGFQSETLNSGQEEPTDFPKPLLDYKKCAPSFTQGPLRQPEFQQFPPNFNQNSSKLQGIKGCQNFPKRPQFMSQWQPPNTRNALGKFKAPLSFRDGPANEQSVRQPQSIFQKIPSLLQEEHSFPNYESAPPDVGYPIVQKHLTVVEKRQNPQSCEPFGKKSEDLQERSSNQQFPDLVFRSPPGFHRRKSVDYSADFESHQTGSSYESSPRNTRRKSLLPTPDYSGHRPPSSDHYGLSVTVRNDEAYNKSIGDTVDIIKKRLMDRQDNPTAYQKDESDIRSRSRSPTELPEKTRKSHRLSSRWSSSSSRSKSDKKCSKMKKKIVKQLFKMDKNALQKFVDDPHSSSKFECAINCLITESRNSLNKHLRSAAEKSLSGNTNVPLSDDTVYEDIFMKQMQCILDPEDTVTLTDIKPMVMAEINKVLELDEYGNQCNYSDEDESFHSGVNHEHYERRFKPERINYEADAFDPELDTDPFDPTQTDPFVVTQESTQSKPKLPDDNSSIEEGMYFSEPEFQPKPEEDIRQLPRRLNRNNSRNQEEAEPEDARPTFPTNMAGISDDEDPFAEWDKQYHAAVDYTAIEDIKKSPPKTLVPVHNNDFDKPAQKMLPEKHQLNAYNEDCDFKKSRIQDTMLPITRCDIPIKLEPGLKIIKQKTVVKPSQVTQKLIEEKKEAKCHKQNKRKSESREKSDVKRQLKIKREKSESPPKSMVPMPRKRDCDDKISHRKEKRKKSESEKQEGKKSILNKNIIINVNDCTSKNSDKCDSVGKSVFNLFFSKPDLKEKDQHEEKTTDSVNTSYSDKYVKRKYSTDKDDYKKSKVKSTPTSINKPEMPTKENSVNSTESPKRDCKVKLQPIDMFEQQPRKTPILQPRRNSSVTIPESVIKTKTEPHTKPSPLSKKRILGKRSLATQTVNNFIEKFTQTRDRCCKKVVGCQTDPVTIDDCKDKGNKEDEVLERMKKMDILIHQLLQERSKFYYSVGSAEKSAEKLNTSEAIGSIDEGELDKFATMSEEELQDIALQDVESNVFSETERDNAHKKVKKRSKKANICSVDEVTSTIDVSKVIRKTNKHKRRNTPKIVLKLNKSPVKNLHCDSPDEYQVVKASNDNTLDKKPNTSKVAQSKKVLKSVDSINLVNLVDRNNKNDEKLDGVLNRHENKVCVENKIKNKKVTFNLLNKNKKTNKVLDKQKYVKLFKHHHIKECSVVLQRIVVFSRSLLSELDIKHEVDEAQKNSCKESAVKSQKFEIEPEAYVKEENIKEELCIEIDCEVQNDDINDLHVDMMDVSEDIVIDDNCDNDKSVVGCEQPDEVVLDTGSVSSVEEPSCSEDDQVDQCRTYDFSKDGDLEAESVGVTGHEDAIIAIECIKDNFLAASLDGSVYYFNGRDGQLLSTLRGSNLPVTCLSIVEEACGTTVYTGSLDSRIRYYDLKSGKEKGPECNVLSAIQSMDRAWDTIYVGTRTGFVLQFECKNNMLIPLSSEKFSEQAILALRAIKEGPRKVLLVASRSENVTIKDAQTGLLLRTLEGPKMTVYSLLFEDGNVYCGTSSHLIQVFEYVTGCNVGVHNGGKGAVCLRMCGGLLFAGCYDGCVYVYRSGVKEPIAQLRGPSNMLLSLAVIHSRIVAGYKDRSLFIWKIPPNILKEMIL